MVRVAAEQVLLDALGRVHAQLAGPEHDLAPWTDRDYFGCRLNAPLRFENGEQPTRLLPRQFLDLRLLDFGLH